MSYKSFCAIVLALAAPAFAAPHLPLNRPVKVSGITAVCTGVGENRQNNPRWKSYPLKIVYAGKEGQWVTDGEVQISRRGRQIFAAHCFGPWLLVKLPAGRYRIAGQLEGQHYATKAFSPQTGQGRVILRFPKSGGTTSAEHTKQLRAMAENHRTPLHPSGKR